MNKVYPLATDEDLLRAHKIRLLTRLLRCREEELMARIKKIQNNKRLMAQVLEILQSE